ncbi:Cd(II)/Pb(II)-responsive transcriptional regulator [Rheinheimera maricola]|uniref:Cd(II)/Pb(II)-responsive transcriptional regulator n=1 Tax=Rheinheimera maricola TaxID=2793282 RepID=A0ABS7X803_9GAMM|nr:Cd(II)/Pb(II)-responsive transcriptional regulator [Rheinheimera maricola]MBZ9611671.1 Cd(II)/Pb(II)-responsive transcriptional regulator [Rheinheimera maricola]
MKISALACITQVPAKTIRYYESVGLLTPPTREANGYRYYKGSDVETLVFIRRCRELNIPIDDIKQLVDVKQNPQASCTTVDNIIIEQLARVRQMQQELSQLEQTLSHLVNSCESEKIQDCCILQSLNCTGWPSFGRCQANVLLGNM